MNESTSKEITIDDFSVICRICLQNDGDMTDIFQSGIEKQLMEVADLKVEIDDKLPSLLCQQCSALMHQLLLFVQQAKSSDVYLRSLLSVSETNQKRKDLEVKSMHYEKKVPYRKAIRQLQKRSQGLKKSDSDNEKMYLIFVPDSKDSNTKVENEICIKDLNLCSENVSLTNYCRTLVRSHFLDHTYPKEQKDNVDDKSFLNEEQKTFTVNLFVYECSECKGTFEEVDDLTTHFLTHETEPLFLRNNFNCPVCDFSSETKTVFLNHLHNHKQEGFLFMKVNPAGDLLVPKPNEKYLFLSDTNHVKVFGINVEGCDCAVCCERLQSKDTALEHLESCLSKKEIKYNLRYSCPVCQESFYNDEINFIHHLKLHKENWFVKVNSEGEPVKLDVGDDLFIPFEIAVDVFINKTPVFQIVDLNSCDNCNFTSESFQQLNEHYREIHSTNFSNEISCPVCLKEFKDENLDKFYEHLKVHKSTSIHFILVNKNGELVDCGRKYEDIFTQSLFLWHKMNSSSFSFQICSPQLENTLGKYTCDICSKRFKKKQQVIAHLKSHQESVHYICEKCGKKCLGKVSYKKHFLKHNRNLLSASKKPICTICDKTFASRSALISHMKHHLKEGKGSEFDSVLLGIICEVCGKSFSNNGSLTKHKKMHLKEKENAPLKCEICHKDFSRQSSFERHKSAHLNPKYFECNVCRLPLPSVGSLQKHSEIHKNGVNTFDCKACKISFLTKDSLTAHQTHTGHHQDRKPLECNVCHEKFFIGRKFTEHIKSHPKYKMGECSLCGKRLSTIQSLMLHMGRHFESNSILCPHCGRQFFEERNYHRHLLTHEGIKPFPCDSEGCKKSFYTLFELNRHKKYHNNTRDFRCIYCSKSFHEANHLTVHIRTHTGERPYTCPHCNKGFVTRTHCKHHIKLVHQGIGYDLIRSNISKKVTVFEAIETLA